ncbi:MAG: hypothetical protein M0R06_23100 [Sphaerochaeta sp.]|jgi:hypothetical protein|nr:hypothetical protein [Sphaerochaeta sp.]
MPFVNAKTGRKATDELIVYPGEYGGDSDGIGVIVYPDGRVSNRWGDGTVGLSDEVREAASEETEAYEPYTHELYIWKHDEPKPKSKSASRKRKSIKQSSSRSTGIRGVRG